MALLINGEKVHFLRDKIMLKLIQSQRLRRQLLLLLILFGVFTIAVLQGVRSFSIERGLKGYYYDNLEWAGFPLMITQDSSLTFSKNDLTFLFRKYSLQWIGMIYIPGSGEYQFTIPAKERSTVSIDSKIIIDNEDNQGFQDLSGTVFLDKGFHTITIRHIQESRTSVLYDIYWKKPGKEQEKIPHKFLFPEAPEKTAFFLERAFVAVLTVVKLIWLICLFLAFLILLTNRYIYKRVMHYLNIEFLLLVLFLLVINFPYFAPDFNFFPIRDTMASAGGNFFLIYNEYFLHDEIPLWMPYNLYGIQFDYEFLISMSPALCFMTFIGKWLGVVDTLLLFKTGIFIEQLALLVGMYLLSKRLFSHFAAMLFVCIGPVAVSYWALAILWNFRVYYLMPLTLFFLIKFYDTYRFHYLFIAGIITVLASLGNRRMPFYLLFYFVFALVLFSVKIHDILSHIKNILRPFSLLCLFFFLSISIILLQYITTIFDYTVIYGGRDQVTGQGSFEDFFLLKFPISMESFFEMIYAIPTSHDITIYIGLIPLIFLIYALLKAYDDHILKTLLIAAVFIFMLSLPKLTFVASIVYYLAPFFRYCRALYLTRSVLKILLLLVSGFGVEKYLSSYSKPASRFSIIWIGLGMLTLIIGLDAFAFKGMLPYMPGSIFQAKYAYYFHYLALCIVTIFLYLMYCTLKYSTHNIQLILVLCFAFEIASYHYFLFFLSPAKFPDLPKQQYETVEEYKKKVDFVKSSYNVRRYSFRNGRTTREQTQQLIDRTAPLITIFYGPKYTITYSLAYVDPCFQDFEPQYLPLSIDRFARARKGIALDKPLVAGMPLPNELPEDPVFLRAFGCNAPKLFLTSQVHIATSLQEAANIIHTSQDIDKVPVLFKETFSEKRSHYQQTSQPEPSGEIQVTYFTVNSLSVNADVSSPDGAWLVYLDGYHPDWSATVNGQPRYIVTANLAFKAVQLDSGPNEVHFKFRGNGFNGVYIQIFFILGIVSTFFLLAIVIWLSISRAFSVNSDK